MTPTEARAAFLWSLTTPEQIMAAATTPELKQAAADKLGVSLRTVQRHQHDTKPCPAPRCLTRIPVGRELCHFCRRSAEL